MPRPRAFTAGLFLASAALCSFALAEPATPGPVGTASHDRFLNIFRPLRTDSAALSPDGKFLAYSLRQADRIHVVVVSLDDPSKAPVKLLVATDEAATPLDQMGTREKVPARINRMAWADDGRLIIETNASFRTQTSHDPDQAITLNTPGAIIAIDADGSNQRVLATPVDVTKSVLARPFKSDLRSELEIVSVDQYALREQAAIEKRGKQLEGVPENPMEREEIPRSPVFFDFLTEEPDQILIRTSDPRDFQLYIANIHSGKLTPRQRHVADDDTNVLLTRQGEIGAAIKSTGSSTAFPRSYLLAKNGAITWGKWRSLDSVSKTPLTFSLSPENYFGERSFPVGFDENPDVLYYASNVGRDKYGVYAINITTGEKTGRTFESAAIDLVDPAAEGFATENPLVFDRHTRELVGLRYKNVFQSAIWLRADLRDAQNQLHAVFPGKSVCIHDWDRSGTRLLVQAYSPTDAGGFYIFEPPSKKLLEFARAAPAIGPNEPLHYRFYVPSPSEGALSGLAVIPAAVRQKPVPIIVVCGNDPWLQIPSDFDPAIRALSEMGFAVMQINPRGVWGFGAKYRQQTGSAYDEAQVQDIVTAIDALCQKIPLLSSKHVGVLGHRRGGFLALRALQLRPDRFRCAVGINPTVDLKSWISDSRWNPDVALEDGFSRKPPAQHQRLENDYARWLNLRDATTTTATREIRLIEEREDAQRKINRGTMRAVLTRHFFGQNILDKNALIEHPGQITRPVFLLPYRRDGESASAQYKNARTLAREIEDAGGDASVLDLREDYINELPEARAEVFRQIEDFLNLNIYKYNVQMGEASHETLPDKGGPQK